MRIANFGKTRAVPSRISAVRPGPVSLLACVFSDETGQESGCDGFEGWDGCGKDSDVGLDDGPVHGAADHVGGVGGGEHGGDVGDSDDGGNTGAGGFERY